MNNTNRNYLLAAILIVLGLLLLGKEFNFFDFNWSNLFRFWPLLLIFLGINYLLGGKTNGSSTALITILCCIAIPLSMMNSCGKNWDRKHNNSDWNWNFDDDNDGNNSRFNQDENDENDNEDNDNDEDSDNNDVKIQNFEEKMDASIKTGILALKGGVAGIDVNGTTDKLFEANTKTSFSEFHVKNNVANGVANIEILMNKDNDKNNNIELKNGNFNGKNEAKIKLNQNIEWKMTYEFGVAGADLDLSPFNVKSLDIKTGVSGVDLKLSDKAAEMKVEIDAGIAGIKIKVPKSSGVKIHSESFLSGNNFEGFSKDSEGYYRSPDYDKSTKKITIDYKGAFASFDVERY